jgi:hypothetical protein
MINEVDESLRLLLLGELSRVDEASITQASQITFLPPSTLIETPPKGAHINLYLHDVRENLRFREHERSLSSQGGDADTVSRRRAPINLDLAYLITVHAGGDPSVEHRLLTEILGVLLRAGILPARYMSKKLQEDPESRVLLAVAQPDHPAHSDPTRLWQALGGPLRPTLGLIATATFNPFETRVTRLVREAVLALGPGIPPNGPQRPLSIKTTRVSTAGVVCGPDGAEIAGVAVQAKGYEVVARTNEKGFFHLLDLPAGRVTLIIRHKGFRTQEVSTNVPPIGRSDLLEPLGITLEPLGDAEAIALEKEATNAALIETGREVKMSLTGRLAYASGNPAAFVVVRAGSKETTTDGEGFYTFNNLKEKVTTLVAMVPGVGEVSVTPSDSTTSLPAREAVTASSEKAAKPRK